MSTNSHDRDLRQARLAYVAAVRRLDAAMDHFGAADVPLDPGPGSDPKPWTAHHLAAMREVTEAFVDVFNRRRTWDGMRRDWRPQH
ncbi:hypothetical protein GCM10009557_01010 [Virgisporangium ochraceum]|uniref:Uncharacterized protein n=1 Tax=Virgisporangium ochraceum TaxID=65505 RepID=A0A8J4A3H4_9ACTN|nr:hypothetical protein [Virgisporangium ochraceum]GIJ74133.1 hypothetical protein Voc01_090500 [Virgisporangium ochraceum]